MTPINYGPNTSTETPNEQGTGASHCPRTVTMILKQGNMISTSEFYHHLIIFLQKNTSQYVYHKRTFEHLQKV